ncbi:cytochrome P450 [Mariannaea sp. PMI_226]|nr:cytochrome P450 [Mariannaea sp. PMI_226]
MALLQLDVRGALLLVSVAGVLVFLRLRQGPKITRDGVVLRKPPNTLPFVGNGIVFLKPRQQLFAWFTKCERLCGYETLQIAVPSLPPGVIVSDPRNLEFVLRNEKIFEKGDFFKQRSWDLFGHGIINVDGELWRLQRKAGLRFLAAPTLKALTNVRLPEYLNQAIDALRDNARNDQVVDLQTVVHEVTTQLMGRMAYNMEMHADDDFTLAFEYASGATAERFQNPLWFITELFRGGKLRQSIGIVKDHGRQIVASAVADRASSSDKASGSDTPGSLIQSLLGSIGDETLVSDAALNYLSAGRDTVAQALTWTLYLLMKHPLVTQSLRDAVQCLLEDQTSSDTSRINPEDLTPTKLPYALAVFYESLRLYPPIPFEIKQAQQDTTLPDGTFLPRSAIVVWCAWAMNRSHETWGPDADEFRPERWLTDDGAAVAQRTAAEFPVFNGGPRICLGKRMAELVAVQVLARLVGEFGFEPAFEGERVSKSSLTLPMEGGLPVHVHCRASSLG